MELIQGIVYDLQQLSHLTKLEELSLKEIGSQTASIGNFGQLPQSKSFHFSSDPIAWPLNIFQVG